MTMLRLGFAGLAAFLFIEPALAGPCTAEIDRAQVRLDSRIDAVAGAGATGTQSSAAEAHRQPTPGSVARAEEKLGEGTSLEPALAALAQARKADAEGDRAGCETALGEVVRIVGP
jgi:hypothetical protein